MGFRYQKRFKLGKGIGLNISKSGITPSYRSKRMYISTKSYSIKTGIPGLSYRKSFKKSQNKGCLVLITTPILYLIYQLINYL